ncbi:serine/threonine-protein phosphatase 2A regulatory subunit B'' subunit beta [Agrilus planipennis]|uniref:Serine/threonine-protein phosphatase 2A regulatory subunit B'' subunit beta n=1 Tax=Agrilus planipennis TaxID=224129 RepID=A0A7F5RI61_AGRPL|nr:serine/threonine-protein phosphatase 2A regulatory subunit B'' subunit beta [Agrilus planipennis]
MMATTARRRDPDDDIAAIAKQISDQAEAIYQNWKARGLAPAEILNCHAAGDTSRLDSMLKPQPVAKSSIELLAQSPTMDNNRLEKLVKNFVVEDKARLAARNKNMASSIQYALQKFEKNATAHSDHDNYVGVRKVPLRTNNYTPVSTSVSTSVTTTMNNSATVPVVQTQITKPAISQKPQLSPKPRLPETVEVTFPDSNLQAWPLKNKFNSNAASENSKRLSPSSLDVKPTTPTVTLISNTQYNSLPTKTAIISNSISPPTTKSLVDEVALEEKKLINALKNGVVIILILFWIQLPPKQQVAQHTTLQRHVRAHRNVHIPKFHFPAGKPSPPGHLEAVRARVSVAFANIGERASREHFEQIVKACQLPLYWKTPLYLAACADKGSCTLEQFMQFWTGMATACHDAASRFVYMLTRGRRNWLGPEDFIPLVQDVVETHPGLTFLKEATEFHSRYVHTVIARIFYCVNRSWSGRISISELRRSNLLNIIQLLEEEEDINQITAYFSYEHFYVIYCKFWELDRDHDLYIDKHDLARHSDHALSFRIIDRIFSGCVTRGQRRNKHDEKMSYTEFVWFLLSEEDKNHPTAIEYWFRCMDIDGDGYLSMYELEYFYEEQMHRMDAIGIETLPFQDCLCQMLDMVKPKVPGKIALSDLKKCKMTSIFFDTFFNLEKYLDHEQRDPFASQREHDYDGQEMSDWDRYAAEEYELLVAEEGNDQPDSLSYEDGNDEDFLSSNLDGVLEVSDMPISGLSDESDECSI